MNLKKGAIAAFAVTVVAGAAFGYRCCFAEGGQHGDHGQGGQHSAGRLMIHAEKSGTVEAGQIEYAFQLMDHVSHRELSDQDLNVTHEKILHMLVYDASLNEFQHVHPEFSGGKWSVPLEFQVNGRYWIWMQGELKDGGEFTVSTELAVENGRPEWPAPALTELRSATNGVSVASMSGNVLRAGRMAMLDVTFTRQDGSPAQIEPYLGAFAHVVAVPESGDELLHVHPMSGGKPNQGMLHVTFPKAGMYRLWVQFIDAGVLKVVPLAVRVE
jgi:hypothetical protein